MEEAQQRLLTAVDELVFTHGIEHKTISDSITKHILQRVSNLPKRKILYNACHGGFDVSDDFLEYISNTPQEPHESNFQSLCYLSRQHYASLITPFGKKCLNDLSMTKLQYLKDMIYIYHKYNFKKVYGLVSLINMYNNEQTQKEKASVYRNDALQLIPSQTLDEFITFHSKMYNEASYRRFGNFTTREPFLQAVSEYGIQDKITWSHNSYYTFVAVKYLISKYQLLFEDKVPEKSLCNDELVYDVLSDDYIKINEELMNEVEEQFGLLCASGSYCMLAIAEIPSVVDFTIDEYDGLETVRIV